MNRFPAANARYFIVAVFLLSLFCTLPGAAETLTWTGTVSSDAAIAENWNPQQVPGIDDTVIFPAGASARMDLTQDMRFTYLYAQNREEPSVLSLGGHLLTLTNATNTAGGLLIEALDFHIDGGAITSKNFCIGTSGAAGLPGGLTLSNTAVTAEAFFSYKNSRLALLEGSEVNSTTRSENNFGENGSNAELLIDNSHLYTKLNFNVWNRHTNACITVQNGGSLTSGNYIRINGTNNLLLVKDGGRVSASSQNRFTFGPGCSMIVTNSSFTCNNFTLSGAGSRVLIAGSSALTVSQGIVEMTGRNSALAVDGPEASFSTAASISLRGVNTRLDVRNGATATISRELSFYGKNNETLVDGGSTLNIGRDFYYKVGNNNASNAVLRVRNGSNLNLTFSPGNTLTGTNTLFSIESGSTLSVRNAFTVGGSYGVAPTLRIADTGSRVTIGSTFTAGVTAEWDAPPALHFILPVEGVEAAPVTVSRNTVLNPCLTIRVDAKDFVDTLTRTTTVPLIQGNAAQSFTVSDLEQLNERAVGPRGMTLKLGADGCSLVAVFEPVCATLITLH